MPKAVEKSFGKRAELPSPRRRLWPIKAARSKRAVFTKAPDKASPVFAGKPAPDTRLAGLDLLRFVAAFAVLMFHFGYAGATRGTMATGFPAIADVAKYGFLGVDLFFLISGYVITASAYGRSWQEFAIARFIRLYPAHVVCMTMTAVVLFLFAAGTPPVTVKQWLANMTMVSPLFGQPFMDGVYWSIVIEIIFYGWVALLLRAGLFQQRLLTILTIWLAIAFLNETVLQLRGVRLALCTEYAALFATGILFQRLRAGETNPYAWTVLGYAFGLGFLHAFENERVFARLYGDQVSLPLMWVLHVALIVLFWAAITYSSRIKATRAALVIGGLTYPLYLVHQQVGSLSIDRLAPIIGTWPALLLVVAGALAFSYVVYRWVEPAGRRVLSGLVKGDRGTSQRLTRSPFSRNN